MVWSRADALTGLHDGMAVSNWPNAAGTQQALHSDGAHCPQYFARGLNNRPVIRFAGDATVTPKIVQYFPCR